jgi:hypothetical protein
MDNAHTKFNENPSVCLKAFIVIVTPAYGYDAVKAYRCSF